MSNSARQRTIAYIDGFNLYFGLRESGYRRYYWLNVKRLMENLLLADQELVMTKYFTARISASASPGCMALAENLRAKRERQSDFLEALATLPDFAIFYGHYLHKPTTCRKCGHCWADHEEKMTDVNIATELLRDAFEDRFDTAILLSADSDLVPPIRVIRELFPGKRVVVVFPPARFSHHLRMVAHAHVPLGRAVLAKSQFPDQLTKPDGHVLRRPLWWR